MQLSIVGGMPQRTDFSRMACSVARTWQVIGEPWTPLILRDMALGMTRFEEFHADLGIARNVLSDRLQTLTEAGVVRKRDYMSANRLRQEYVLTEMGKELQPIIMAISQWGDRWLDDGEGPPVVFHHIPCGELSTARIVCSRCGEDIGGHTTPLAGPGSEPGPGTSLADEIPTQV